MQIVIDIPEDVIEGAKSSPNYYPTYHFEKIWRAIVNGKPLPKGHGDFLVSAIKNGVPHETVTEFADRCRECGREKVLNKIRAEIEELRYGQPFRKFVVDECLEIIDKYKAKVSSDKYGEEKQ